MGLRNFKIGTRLGLGFGCILAILVIVVLAATALNYRNKAQLLSGLELVGHVDPKADRGQRRLRVVSRSVRRGHRSAAAVKSLAEFLGLRT